MKKLLLSVLASFFMLSCQSKTNEVKEGTDSIIKIGVPEPLTGELSQYGVSIKEGIELKIDEINKQGGINGKLVELIVSDTKGDLQETVNIAKKMISVDKVNAILGEAISANSFAIAELAQKSKTPFITPAGTRFDITKDKDFAFRATFTDPFQGEVLAKYIKEKGFKKVAILTNTSSDYSVGISEVFKNDAAKESLSFSEQKYTKDDKDFKSLLTNIKNEGSDAVLIPDYYNTIGLILSQAKELGLETQYFGADGWDGVQRDFAEVAEGAIFTTQYFLDDDSEDVKKFNEGYKNKFSKDPNLFSALGYDAATILVEALSKVKNINDSEEIKEALKASDVNLVTGKLKFDENRNPSKNVTFLTIKDKKLMLKDKF